MSNLVNLCVRTEYNLLSSSCKIEKIAAKTAFLGQAAVSICDKNNIFGAFKFSRSCDKYGIKPIIGCDVSFSDGNHTGSLLLYVKNEAGYKSLCRILSDNSLKNNQSSGFDIDLLKRYNEGLICVIPTVESFFSVPLSSSEQKICDSLIETFGEDIYLGIFRDDGIANDEKEFISAFSGVKLLLLSDIRMIDGTDEEVLEILSSIGGKKVFGKAFLNITDAEEMFHDIPEALENTCILAEKCNFSFETNKRFLPRYPLPEGITDDDYLSEFAFSSFKKFINNNKIIPDETNTEEKYINRIKYELSIISGMGFSSYFLIVADYVSYAKKRQIAVGPGRGSGAASLVAYLIGITDINPLKFNLLFESFLNPERTSMPDFDIDFCYERRDEVIDYVIKKYGREKVSQIITFGTFGARESIRDAARYLKISPSLVDETLSCIPKGPGITLSASLNSDNKLKKLYSDNKEVHDLLDCALKIEGLPRHISKHAAGIIITDEPIYGFLPLYGFGEDVVSQFDMNDVASLGLLKFDFLGLRFLTIIDKTKNSIKTRTGKNPEISFTDGSTYDMLSKGMGTGIFQLESEGIKRLLVSISPREIKDIMSVIALYRPGPMAFINDYIAKRNNPSSIKYDPEALRPILEETYGCIVYQEQVLEIFREIAGYPYGKADIIRRAISKKKADIIEQEKESFISGVIEKGSSKENAEKLFESIEGFSNYGFKKSHAAAYSLISYTCAFLKRHYPADYMAALINESINDNKKVFEYIIEANKLGVTVICPDINMSDVCTKPSPDGRSIILGFTSIRGVGKMQADSVIKERQNGIFKSFTDFSTRLFTLNSLTLEGLSGAGAFDSIEPRRPVVSGAPSNSGLNAVAGQLGFFDEQSDEDKSATNDLSPQEKAECEKKYLGFSKGDINKNIPVKNDKKIIKENANRGNKIFIRVPDMQTTVFKRTIAFISLFGGSSKVVYYDLSRKKYSELENRGITINEFTIKELKEIVGEDNIVVQ